MDTPLTSTGKACKKCLAKGPGERCHLHCSKGTSSKTTVRTVTKKTPAKTRPRSPEESKSIVTSTPSPRSATGKKKAKARASPLTPLTPPKSLSPPRTPMAMSPSPASIKPRTPLSLEKEWRLGRDSPGMGSLGWEAPKAKLYTKPERMERLRKYEPEAIGEQLDFPEEFKIVYQKLIGMCEQVPDGICMYHPQTPAVQWSNKSEGFEKAKEAWELEMRGKVNHYFTGFQKGDNDRYPAFDRGYCYCHESGREKNAFQTLLLPVDGLDEKWNEIHGEYSLPGRGVLKRNVSKELREKIKKDTIEFFAQEYKIHLQPKPEYQFPVLRILAHLLETDKEFNAHVDTWKAVIPYHRVKTELNLPVIVIYPVWGEKSAKIVLRKLVKAFESYDTAKIGLNHAPRFNEKYNELIYYAGGAGDHKRILPDEFFTEGKKFYKGHVLKL